MALVCFGVMALEELSVDTGAVVRVLAVFNVLPVVEVEEGVEEVASAITVDEVLAELPLPGGGKGGVYGSDEPL